MTVGLTSTHGPWRPIVKHESVAGWDCVTLSCGHERMLQLNGRTEKWTKLRCSSCKTPGQTT